ncbi:C40 family peptidase [Nocardia sp. XZ_19_385]|uniref:C40 family peptidase n=1 Tax=Nocardia sp. XZ_19_385 TaxID=2769488 RepID=UPI001E624D7A|nr:C40 family peptidase [Nocardia sp. XZ_19_385]
MDSPKTLVAGALMLPMSLILMLLVFVGADLATSCAAALSGPAGSEGSESSGASVAGLNERQLQLARNGVAIGKQRGMPETVILAELVAQATESTFRNLANSSVPESLSYAHDGVGHDHDSVGPHQMRVSVWGSVGIAGLMDPLYQINWFYDQSTKIVGAEQMTPPQLAQAVERSAPNAYAGQMDLARKVYAMFADTAPATMSPPQPGQLAAGCGPTGSGAPTTPAGPFGQAVIDAAMHWLRRGTPYVWGGGDQTGPTMGGFDCSGLTLYAIFQASGGRILLPHYTQSQQDHSSAVAVPFAERAPGDLIFFTIPGKTDSHHVGIYYGRDGQGQDLLLHAPQTGQNVTITPLSAWEGEQMAVRRYSQPQPGATAGGVQPPADV